MFDADQSRPGTETQKNKSSDMRLTWQMSPKNRFSAYYNWAPRTTDNWGLGSTVQTGAAQFQNIPLSHFETGTFRSTLTSKMLFEAAMGNMTQNWTREPARNNPTSHGYPVTEQTSGVRFRAYDLAFSQNITSLRSYRRTIKADGEANNEAQVMERAKTLWKLRWSLLKKPANVSGEEKQALAELESEDAGFVQRCRHIIRQLVHIFDHTHSEAQARIRLQQLRQDMKPLADRNLEKILTFFDDHWDQAFRYLRKKGMGKHRRGSNSESGMRLLRRLEKNHDGIRSAATRQHYIQIYQAMKYLSLDIADFIEKGPQLAEFPDV